MPYAVTHVLIVIILVGLYRDYVTKHKKYFTLHTLFIAGFAGLMPDMDVAIEIFADFLKINVPPLLQHGGIFHTPLFGLIFLIPGFILWKKQKHRIAMYFFVITFGILLHLFLDWFLGGGNHYGIMLLWPLSLEKFKLHILYTIGVDKIPQAIDALLLLGWVWYIEAKHKISDFV